MTKKDYVKIAAVIREAADTHTDYEAQRALEQVVADLGEVFYEDNPSFKMDAFILACFKGDEQ